MGFNGVYYLAAPLACASFSARYSGIYGSEEFQNFSYSMNGASCLISYQWRSVGAVNWSSGGERPNMFPRQSSCSTGSPISGNQCNGTTATIEKPLERVFEDNIVNKPWNADFASIAAATIAMGIFRDGNLFTDNIDIIGPNAVPLGETTGTWPVNVLPGTTTPAPAGHTGPTEPGTVTQTSTTTAQNTFRPGSSGSTGSGSSSGPGASMTTTQKTETKTSITNNITNVTNIVNTETKTEDKPPEDNATDTPLAGIPEL